jgi:transcriptional regulator with XRE-family HTH domain
MSRAKLGRRSASGNMVREAREKLGLTQEELAQRLEVTVSSVQKWELYGVVPRKPTLRKIYALAAGVAPAQSSRERRGTSHQARQAMAALELILERAPEEMIASVVDFLIARAVKYGSPD